MRLVNVFTYGSLMFAPVWERVVSGRYHSVPAQLFGHARYAVREESYPGMVPETAGAVAGLLYYHVRPHDVAALDLFEGSDYRRDTVQVLLADGSLVEAQTYIYLRPELLTREPWRPEAFAMQRFLRSYCGGE